NHGHAFSEAGGVAADEASEFRQQPAANNHLITLSTGDNGNGGGGGHVSGMRNAARERKLDFRSSNQGRYPQIPTTMPDEPTQPSSPSPNSTSGLAPNVAAGLCAIFSVVASIIFLLIEKKDEYVRFWAAQMLALSIALIAFFIALTILFMILGMIGLGKLVVLLGCLINLPLLALSVVSIVLA